ncbi:uncharacterized protein LOC131652773 [Vicia villosa]|uniref:uncharacterized protein LOC131652773 n=1 Tax=Vicia villosa TaxID=3911 RepID=UPI00273BF3DE|nr:uncharacterized protein LOC131652773 [Vicia villosa]
MSLFPPKITYSQRRLLSLLSAISSFHRTILHPHNSLLITHSTTFLTQGISQLLSDCLTLAKRRLQILIFRLPSLFWQHFWLWFFVFLLLPRVQDVYLQEIISNFLQPFTVLKAEKNDLRRTLLERLA